MPGNTVTTFLIICGILIYCLAQVLRAVRIWFIFGDIHISFRNLITIFFITGVVGFIIPNIFAELVKTILLLYFIRNFILVGMSVLVARSLDLIIIGCLFSFFSGSNEYQGLFPAKTIIIDIAIGIGILFSFSFCLARAHLAVQGYLLRNFHNKFGIILSQLVQQLNRASKALVTNWSTTLATPFVLTVIIWCLDITAAWMMLERRSWLEVLLAWLDKSLIGVFLDGTSRYNINSENILGPIANKMFIPLIVLSLVFTIERVVSLKREKKFEIK